MKKNMSYRHFCVYLQHKKCAMTTATETNNSLKDMDYYPPYWNITSERKIITHDSATVMVQGVE